MGNMSIVSWWKARRGRKKAETARYNAELAKIRQEANQRAQSWIEQERERIRVMHEKKIKDQKNSIY